MKTDNRDYGLDILRLLCMFMLATYHFLNYYGGQYINVADAGKSAIIVQNFLWGGRSHDLQCFSVYFSMVSL